MLTVKITLIIFKIFEPILIIWNDFPITLPIFFPDPPSVASIQENKVKLICILIIFRMRGILVELSCII